MVRLRHPLFPLIRMLCPLTVAGAPDSLASSWVGPIAIYCHEIVGSLHSRFQSSLHCRLGFGYSISVAFVTTSPAEAWITHASYSYIPLRDQQYSFHVNGRLNSLLLTDSKYCLGNLLFSGKMLVLSILRPKRIPRNAAD